MRFFLCTLIFFLLSSTSVVAATYEMLKPQEVEDKSQFIVRGTYNFEVDAISGQHMYKGYEFFVTDVLKGDVKTGVMIVGLSIYDASWVKEHQENGGDFLLFIDKDNVNEFYVPVLGTNGLVQVSGGVVLEEDKKRAIYFQNMINGKEQHNGKLYYLWGSALLIIILLARENRAFM